MKKHYTNIGNVRGSCGHKHKTEATAQACLQRDQRGCRFVGGYSDRKMLTIYITEGTTHRYTSVVRDAS
jgi:hypothetical protein